MIKSSGKDNGKPGRYWCLAICIAMAVLFVWAVPKSAVVSAPAAQSSVPGLMREIQTINLINGLYISNEQIAKLLPAIESAVSCEERLNGTLSENDREMESILLQMRKELTAGGAPSKETIERFHRVEVKVQERRFDYLTAKKKVLGSVKGLLTENQKALISEYQPCIIPATQQANPERIGQSGNNDMLVNVLEKSREVSESEYGRFKSHFLENTRRMITLHRPDADIDEELKRHGEILDRARAMNDVDFEMKKSDLALEFKGEQSGSHKAQDVIEKPAVKDGQGGTDKADGRQRSDLDRKIDEFLLNRYACSYLKSKAAQPR